MTEPSLRVRLSPIAPTQCSLKIYVTAGDAADLREALESAGFQTTEMAEFAFGVDDAIIGVAFLASSPHILKGIAAVLATFLQRNQHTSMTVRSGETEVSVTGMSQCDTEKTIDRLLADVQERQQALDESWKRIQQEEG